MRDDGTSLLSSGPYDVLRVCGGAWYIVVSRYGATQTFDTATEARDYVADMEHLWLHWNEPDDDESRRRGTQERDDAWDAQYHDTGLRDEHGWRVTA